MSNGENRQVQMANDNHPVEVRQFVEEPLNEANRETKEWGVCSMAPQFQRRITGMRVREVLQAVEDALVQSGSDDFCVTTERGYFHWQMFERARVEVPEQPGDELEH